MANSPVIGVVTILGEEDGSESHRPPPTMCQECRGAAAKYRCPKCDLQTCCAACVTAHKTRTGCSGKRDRIPYVRIGEFNDKIVMDDFWFLEDVSRHTDGTKRQLTEFGSLFVANRGNTRGRGARGRGGRGRGRGGGGRGGRGPATVLHLPHHLYQLTKQARASNIQLYFMPRGLSKRMANTTRLDNSTKTIHWRIEWRFTAPDGTVSILCDEDVPDTTTVRDALAKYIEPQPGNTAMRHKLAAFSAGGTASCAALLYVEAIPQHLRSVQLAEIVSEEQSKKGSAPDDLEVGAAADSDGEEDQSADADDDDAAASASAASEDEGSSSSEEDADAADEDAKHDASSHHPSKKGRTDGGKKFHTMDLDLSLKAALEHAVIIEFPTIVVVTREQVKDYCIVERTPREAPQPQAQAPPLTNEHP